MPIANSRSGITNVAGLGAATRSAVGSRPRCAPARPDDDSGVVAILVALLTTVFVALAALVVDHGLASDAQRRAQNAADVSALAAAVVLAGGGLPSDADLKARQYASADFGLTDADWAACTTTLPPGFAPVAGSPCISANAAIRQVRIVLPRRTFPTVFAGIAGFCPRRSRRPRRPAGRRPTRAGAACACWTRSTATPAASRPRATSTPRTSPSTTPWGP